MVEGEFSWIKKLEVEANIAADLDSSVKKENAVSASEKIVERMAHEHEYSREVVNHINNTIRGKINSYKAVANKVDYIKQLYQVAVEAFQELVDGWERSNNTANDKGKHRAYDRWIKEYEEQLREKLGIKDDN